MLFYDTPLVDTDSVDEAWGTLDGKGLGFAPATRADREGFHATLYCSQYPELHFASTAFATTSKLDMYEGREFHAVMLPYSGAFQVEFGKETTVARPGDLAIFSPNEHLSLTQGGGCERFTVYVPTTLLHDRLEVMLGEKPDRSLVFDSVPNPFRNGARFLKTAINRVFQPFTHGSNLRPESRAGYEDFMECLLDHLLHTVRHNCSGDLAKLVPVHVMPGDVNRALEFIHANTTRNISLTTLVEITGVPGRTLNHHFRQFLGASPVRYSRNLRFRGVRNELLAQKGSGVTIADIAHRWGFQHLGRFAMDYRQRFGETPSRTFRARRS